jgi:hypothetical protein
MYTPQIAGLRTVAFMLDNYGHVQPVMRETACDKLEGLLGKKQKRLRGVCAQGARKPARKPDFAQDLRTIS